MTRGTLMIQRRFGKLGYLRVASGTKDPALYAQLQSMLTTLNESRRDVLRALLARRLSPLEVWNAFRVGRLADLPLSPAYLMPLAPTMEAWKDRLKNKRGDPASAKHKASLQFSITHLSAHGATVGDLPDALTALRDVLLPARKRTYQLARAAAMGFLRDLPGVGRYHQLYFDVANVADVYHVPSRQKGMGIAAFREKLAKLDPATTAEAWAMAGTGMRVESEYLAGAFRVHDTMVEIVGAKGGVLRIVPRAVPVLGPHHATYKALRTNLAKAGLKPHTLRRCFGHWCEEAGIPLSRIQLYMGHSSGSKGAGVTGRYLEHDVIPELPGDLALLRKYIGPVELGLRLEKQA